MWHGVFGACNLLLRVGQRRAWVGSGLIDCCFWRCAGMNVCFDTRTLSDALGLALPHYICDFPGMSLPVGGRITYTITVFFHITIFACPFLAVNFLFFLFLFYLFFPFPLAQFQFSSLWGGGKRFERKRGTTGGRCLRSLCARLYQAFLHSVLSVAWRI